MRDRASASELGLPETIRSSLEHILREAERGSTAVSVGRVVQTLLLGHPDLDARALELAEAVLREAATRGISVVIG